MLPAHRDIVYFLEVAQTQNLSRASERLGISQPSLSMSIKRLEDCLGYPVLLRSKSGVTLTKSGQLFCVRAKELLETWNSLKASVNQLNVDVTGLYRIGCHASVAQYSLPHILPGLLEKHPRLEFQLTHDLSRLICEKIISFEIDFGIVVNPIPHPDLVLRELCRDTVQFWISSKGPRAFPKTLFCDTNMLQAQDLIRKARLNSITFDRIITSRSLELIADLVESGAGAGILPRKVIDARPREVRLLDPSLPSFTDVICLVYRADLPKTLATKEIIAAFSAWPAKAPLLEEMSLRAMEL